MAGVFNILQQSPHDLAPTPDLPEPEADSSRWVPSRYNVRATTTDGRLVLWNTYSGKITAFKTSQTEAIQKLLGRQGTAAAAQGLARYLYDRGYLVQEGTDEYRRIQYAFGQQQYRTDRLELILLASEDCNFRCQYCYEDFARGTMRKSVRDGIKRLVEKRIQGLSGFSVSWFGGEPLYGFKAIEDLAPFFLETAERHSLRFGSHMTTNGYLLTPEIAAKLLAWKIDRFQITLDGPPAQHDCNWPARDGAGTFATIFENLKSLQDRAEDFTVDLRVNFDRGNYPYLTELLDLIERDLGNDRRFKLRFRAVGQWGGPNDATLSVCGTDESRQAQAELRAEARRRNLKISEDIRGVTVGSQVCYAARPYNFIVGASGKLMKCTVDLDKNDRNVVGRLTEDGDLVLDEDKMALWTEPAFEQDRKCQKCVVLPACQGTFCPLVRFETGQSPCTPVRRTLKSDLLEILQ